MLIVDIETRSDGKPNPETDDLRVFGAYDPDTEAVYTLPYTQRDAIKTILDAHRVIITFNGDYYDIPVLRRFGVWHESHLSIDLMRVMKRRGHLLGLQHLSYSLKNVAAALKAPTQKTDVDYALIAQPSWTDADYAVIVEYLTNDLRLTAHIYRYLAHYFESFQVFLSDQDNQNYKWLTSTLGVYSYKVICHLSGLTEEYGDKDSVTFPGGFVAEPSGDEYHGTIYILDFNSLYPHNFIQGNLFSRHCTCCRPEERFRANEFFALKGSYCRKSLGPVELVLQRIYNLRKQYKADGRPEQYALKVVLNTMYGICGNPVFTQVYDYNSVYDCTLIGRTIIQYARDYCRGAGYDVVYGDTDSLFLLDPYHDRDRLLLVKQGLIKKVQAQFPFPTSTFDMGIDAEISHLWFFKTGGQHRKKQYVYVTTAGQVVVRGLPMIKRDSSGLGRLIFSRHLEDRVRQGQIRFDYHEIHAYVLAALRDDLSVAARSFKVWDVDTYKHKGQLQAAISAKYGAGTHRLLPNKYIGVGKSIKYCTMDEYVTAKLGPSALVLNKLWTELADFLTPSPQTVTVKDHNGRQEELVRWTNL
jgi:DNA polymerase elongation subunit (family B)